MPRGGVPGNRGSRKPRDLHLLDGTFRPDRHGPRHVEPELDVGPLPPAPSYLEKDARTWWERMRPSLAHRVFTAADVYAFVSFVKMYAQSQAAYAHVEKAGAINPKTGFIRAETKIWMDLTTKLVPYFDRFGMTPMSRAQILKSGGGKNADEPKPEDEFEDDAPEAKPEPSSAH